MAVTLAELRQALGVSATDGGTDANLSRIMGVAAAIVDRYSPDAPTSVKDEATIRLTAYSYDSPTYAERPLRGFQHSGAQALIAPWRKHRGGVIAP